MRCPTSFKKGSRKPIGTKPDMEKMPGQQGYEGLKKVRILQKIISSYQERGKI